MMSKQFIVHVEDRAWALELQNVFVVGRGIMEKARFRPHHIFCEIFLKVEAPGRGEEFERVSQKARDIIERQDDVLVEIIEGIDEICRVCPDCRDGRCQNPKGDEEAVRKWDGIILKGLGANYGETRTSKEWRVLIREKGPLTFCETRCPYRSRCTVGINRSSATDRL